MMNQYPPTSIAIVGMAAQFSGARNVSEFWDVVRNRQVTIRHFSRNDAIQSGLTADEAQSPDRVLAGGVLDEVTNFDAKLFQRTRRELEFADPQQRLLIQCAWTALEDAGCPPRQTKEKVGAFVGGTRSTYRLHQLRNYAPLRGTVEDYELNLGNDNDYLATRLAYHLSLDGPVMNIQTACSTSLAAVHAAAQSLLLEECDVALAGAVSISFPQRVGYIHSPGGILSPSGTCRPFSSQADGTVPGDGVGLVVLKRLEDAIRDGNQIWAVLCGSAVGNDGSQRASFTAPNPQGQARVIVEALSFAQFDPETIGYVEAHGTGTRVGDDIELRALHQVFVPGRVRPHNCVLGTAKACIGHCDAAAGIAGLIKVAMALRHRILPGMPHTEPCSAIAASNSPFVINSDSVTWSASETPRRAAVSSFGLGGTNVHLVAQEYVAQKSKLVRGNGPWLLPVSAETPNALKSAIGNLERHLTTCEYELADVARTLQQGRTILSLRRAFLVHDSETRSLFSGDEFEGPNDVTAGHDAWLFPGQGVDLEGAAGAWWNQFPRFRAILSEHARIVSDRVNVDVLPLLVTGDKQASGELRQLGLVVLEVSIARFLFALGIRPTRLVGHSLGEFSAACVAQIMTFEDMIQVVATRAKLIEDLPIGTMVAVACDEERCRGIVGDDVDIACVNAPAQVVLSADAKSMEVAVNRLRDQGIHTQELPVTHAFHSRHVIPAAASLRQILATVPLRSPIMELISSVTGQRLTDEQARSPDYWAEHLHRPVRFVEVSITLCDEGLRDAIEIGPGRTLIRLIQSLAKRDNRSFHPTLIQNDPTSLSLWTLVARHWCHGVIIDWKQLTTGQSQLVSLPTYEFERETFIFDAPVHNELERSDTLKLNPPAPVSTSEIQRLIPGWQPVSEGTVAPTTTHLLVVAQDSIWAKDCVRRLSGQGRTVTRCAPNGIEILELAESTAFGAVVCLLEDCITELDESAVSLGWETCFSAYRFLREMILTIRRLPEPRPALVLAGRKLLPERIIPIAAFAGLARLALVARQEIPGLLVGCLDLGVEPHATDLYERLGHAIDLIASGHGHLLKLEEGQIHKPNYAAKVTNAPVKSQPLLDPDSAGHYVVFGGHTGVGKAWIQKLLDITPLSRISLICLPDDFVLAQQTASALGPRVIVWSLDEIQSDAVRLVLRSTERQLGKITGIFQAERLYGADDDVTITAPISAHRRHFACRIGILATLAEVVTEFSPEFVCALSSLSSVLGGIGRAPHAASSAAMDAFATSIPQRSCLWGTVNLDLWDVEIPSKANPMELESPHLMSLSEGQIGLLKAIVCLSQDRHSIVVKGNFQKRFQTWVQSRSVSKPDLAIAQKVLQRTSDQSDDIEQEMALLWHQVLGSRPDQPTTPWVALGGDSMKALQLGRLIESRWHFTPPPEFFASLTLRSISTRVRDQLNGRSTCSPHILSITPHQKCPQVRLPQNDQSHKPARFSIALFSGQMQLVEEYYKPLFEYVRAAESAELEAVWLPERHFHPFGGFSPNPSVLAAAVAVRTDRIGIRAGSVVLPLHHPARIVEEWSVVDRLSRGRIGIALASGWSRRDFILSGGNFERRREDFPDLVTEVQRLWRGGLIDDQDRAALRGTYPAPVQNELPIYLSAAGSVETFQLAGRLGVDVLTHLLGQNLEQLAGKITAYRAARAAAGWSPHQGRVVVMVHTLLGENHQRTVTSSLQPLKEYLLHFVDLAALSGITTNHGSNGALTENERQILATQGAQRYAEEMSLIGGTEQANQMVQRLLMTGADEIACLVDFVNDQRQVLETIKRIPFLADAKEVQMRLQKVVL